MKIDKVTMTIEIETNSVDGLPHLVDKFYNQFISDPEIVKSGIRFPDGDSIHFEVKKEIVKI